MDGYKLDFVGTIINCQKDVNVRSEPSTESEIIGVADKGKQSDYTAAGHIYRRLVSGGVQR